MFYPDDAKSLTSGIEVSDFQGIIFILNPYGRVTMTTSSDIDNSP